jgi:hypothetical protein
LQRRLGIAQIVRFGRRRYSTSVAPATGHTCYALKLPTELLTNYTRAHDLKAASRKAPWILAPSINWTKLNNDCDGRRQIRPKNKTWSCTEPAADTSAIDF